MERNERIKGGEGEAAETAREERPGPRIYVASLSDYNDGRLYGAWIDADQEPDELQAAIAAMLARSPTAGAEEWAIHDFEGFAGFRPSEYENLEKVSQVALGIAEHGPAFAAFAESLDTGESDQLGSFGDRYLGRYDSMSSFAETFAADLGWEQELDKLPDGVRPYVAIDYDALGRDLGFDLDWVAAQEGGVYVFDARL